MESIPRHRLERAKGTVRRLMFYLDGKIEKFEVTHQTTEDRQALNDLEWLLDQEIARREVDSSGYATKG